MMWLYLLLVYFANTLACNGSVADEKTKRKRPYKYFPSAAWGGWGAKNFEVAFDSTEVGRDPKSGWPTYWKGMGKGNPGVPPPPWAYVPKSYGIPQFCYLQPIKGTCYETLARWGFNPTSNSCVRFLYSGCGGNTNNFMNKRDCEETCGRTPETECDFCGKVDFRDYIFEK